MLDLRLLFVWPRALSIFHIFLSFLLPEDSLLAAGNGKHLILLIFSLFKMNKMGKEFFLSYISEPKYVLCNGKMNEKWLRRETMKLLNS